jgi:hypothetical protein
VALPAAPAAKSSGWPVTVPATIAASLSLSITGAAFFITVLNDFAARPMLKPPPSMSSSSAVRYGFVM